MKPELMIGTIFKHFRIERKISLRAAAQGLTASTISRFENGQVDISADAAKALMVNIGMDAEELDYLRDTSFPDPFSAFVRGDLAEIRTAAEIFLASRPITPLTRLIHTVLPLLTSDEPPTARLEQQLANLLAHPLLWGNVEATILLAVLPQASSEFKRLIWQRIAKQSVERPNWQHLTVAISALVLISHDDGPLLPMIHQDLKQILAQNKLSTRNIATKPLLIAASRLSVNDNIGELVYQLQQVNANQMADFLASVQSKHALPKKSWHNPSLQDNHKLSLEIVPNEEIISGQAIAKLRKQRGLTIDETIGDWNVSTQSRFETGKISLGFTKLLTLLDTLLIPLARAVVGQDAVTSFEHLQHHLADMGELIEQHTKADFFNLVQQFVDDHRNLPPALLAMQTYAVKSSIARFAQPICETPEEITPSISAKTQQIVIDYVSRLEWISHLDALLLKMILPGVTEPYIESLTLAILPKIKPGSPGESEFYQKSSFLIYGPLYLQKGELLRTVAEFLTYHQRFDADWRVQRGCAYAHLLCETFNQPTPETNQRAIEFGKAFKSLIAYQDAPFVPDRWIQFAIDRDYKKLEH